LKDPEARVLEKTSFKNLGIWLLLCGYSTKNCADNYPEDLIEVCYNPLGKSTMRDNSTCCRESSSHHIFSNHNIQNLDFPWFCWQVHGVF